MSLRAEALAAIRPMAPEDLDAVAAIEAQSFPNPWPREALAHELLQNVYCSSFVAEWEGAVAGYAFLWVIYDEAHLVNVAVAPERRGRGLGEALLVHVLRHAKAQGATGIHLEVRETNAPAITLYLRYGFRVLGRADRYYTDGTPAIFMEADLLGR